MDNITSWRHSTATQTLHFHADYIDAVRAELKTPTIRFRYPAEMGPVSRIFEFNV
ncbi:hypothetical protein ABT330_25380 [Streptomyces sp. NPDC000658]|uniref:hypothetical protein n=1 Tax=Streptomyces sp. NPDC000658 TaxID=3154266 RepID=UPI0033311744